MNPALPIVLTAGPAGSVRKLSIAATQARAGNRAADQRRTAVAGRVEKTRRHVAGQSPTRNAARRTCAGLARPRRGTEQCGERLAVSCQAGNAAISRPAQPAKTAALLACGAGNARHHRLPPTSHPRRHRGDPRRRGFLANPRKRWKHAAGWKWSAHAMPRENPNCSRPPNNCSTISICARCRNCHRCRRSAHCWSKM